MVQAYAAVDRIPSLHLDDIQPTPQEVEALDVDIFLPSEEERLQLR